MARPLLWSGFYNVMGSDVLIYVPWALFGVLVVAIVLELRTGRIPNWLTLLPFALFILVAALSDDRSSLVWQLALGAGVFALGLVLFAFAGFGAGAVKLMSGTALFVPLGVAHYALGVFIAALVLGGVIIVVLRSILGAEDSAWHVLAKNVMPMSIPIGATYAAVMLWL